MSYTVSTFLIDVFLFVLGLLLIRVLKLMSDSIDFLEG